MRTLEWGISGNKERIFVSASWGCQYNCLYCYLKEMGIRGVQCTFTSEELLKELERKQIFVPGPQGSLITIGCYTECWDDINKKTTMEIIEFFLQMGNYVQISTKKKLYDSDVSRIAKSIKFAGQMNIFVSLPTLSYVEHFEPDVDAPDLRVENFNIKNKYEIDVYLYLKPVIKNITIKDKENYAQLVTKYNLPVIVGEMLWPTLTKKGKGIMIGNSHFQEKCCDDSIELINYLKNYTCVYRYSDEAIRQKKK